MLRPTGMDPGNTKTIRLGRVIITILGLALAAGCGGRATETDPRVLIEGETARVALSNMGAKDAEFFFYNSTAGKKVEFFIYRESSGTHRAALDACERCYRWRKGYRLMEGAVVCRKCGESFDIDSLRDGRGSCVPVPLTSTRAGEHLAIPVSELEAGTRYF